MQKFLVLQYVEKCSPQDFKFFGAQAIATWRAACGAPERSEGAKLCAEGAKVGVGGVSPPTGGVWGPPPGKFYSRDALRAHLLPFQLQIWVHYMKWVIGSGGSLK